MTRKYTTTAACGHAVTVYYSGWETLESAVQRAERNLCPTCTYSKETSHEPLPLPRR